MGRYAGFASRGTGTGDRVLTPAPADGLPVFADGVWWHAGSDPDADALVSAIAVACGAQWRWFTTQDLIDKADADDALQYAMRFLAPDKYDVPNVGTLGAFLTGLCGRVVGGWRLERGWSPRENRPVWRIVRIS